MVLPKKAIETLLKRSGVYKNISTTKETREDEHLLAKRTSAGFSA